MRPMGQDGGEPSRVAICHLAIVQRTWSMQLAVEWTRWQPKVNRNCG